MPNDVVPVERIAPPVDFNNTDVERAHYLDTTLREIMQASHVLAYKQAEILYEIYDSQYYRLLGYNSFHEYTESPELGIKKSRAYMLVSVYAFFVVEMKYDIDILAAIPDSDKLGMVLPLAKKIHAAAPEDESEKIQDLISTAMTLTRNDLRKFKSEYGRPIGEGIEDASSREDIFRELKAMEGATLISADRKCEADGSVKLALVFHRPENTKTRFVLFANGLDIDGRMTNA